MELHPQCHELLRLVEAQGASELPSVEEARAMDVWRKEVLGSRGPDVFAVERIAVPTNGGTCDARVYRPTEELAPGVLVWLHGGGWVSGSSQNSDDQTRMLALASGCVVLSLDYRRAPEHRFPAPLLDCYAAVAWAAANAEVLGASPGRIAVGGDSAGGNLAAAVTLRARDQGGPAIDFQVLAYPVACHGLRAPSWKRYGAGHWLTSDTMDWMWRQYLAHEADAYDPYASPLHAESLAGLPAAHVVLAECDILHDEGRLYAERLRDDGVPVELRSYPGMLHGFLACAGVIDAAHDALREAGEAVGAALTTAAPS